MRIVQLKDDGACVDVSVTMKEDTLFLNGMRLFKHLYDPETGVVLCSTVGIDCPFPSFFEFLLPPPLNTYVLPSPLYIVRLKNGAVNSLSVEETVEIIDRLRKNDAKHCRTNDAVYDVPLVLVADDQESDHCEEEMADEDECDSNPDMEEGEEDVDWLDLDETNEPLPHTLPQELPHTLTKVQPQ